jgi:hypothetical protein
MEDNNLILIYNTLFCDCCDFMQINYTDIYQLKQTEKESEILLLMN